jgi:hypothetical protein
MFQESEIVNLLVGFGSVPVVVLLARRVIIPRARVLYGGFVCILVGYAATVLEGMLLPELLNLLEHTSYAAAGLCFLAFAWPARSPTRPRPGAP